MAEMKNLTINDTPFTLPFAPAGYGLGTYGGNATTFNGTIKNGFYSMTGDSVIDKPSEYPNFAYGTLFVKNRFDVMIEQFLAHDGLLARRWSMDGGSTWSPLEWFNPPMLLGVEYRTTERWQGKAVWTQLVSIGQLPNNSTKAVECATFTHLCRRQWLIAASGTYSDGNKESFVTSLTEKSGQVSITTNIDLTGFGYTGTVQLWYTKD